MRNLPSGVEITVDSGQISNTRWVDRDTTIDTADQDGSILKPFRHIQQGLDALALVDPTNVNLMVFPGAYDTAVWTPTDRSLVISNAAYSGYHSLFGTAQGNMPLLSGVLTTSGGQIQVNGLGLLSGYSGNAAACFYGCIINDLLTSNTEPGLCQCQLNELVATVPAIHADQCLFNVGTFTVNGDCYVTNSLPASSSPVTFSFVSGPANLYLDGQTNYWADLHNWVVNVGTIVVME